MYEQNALYTNFSFPRRGTAMSYKLWVATLTLASAVSLSPIIGPAWAETLVGTASDALGIDGLLVDGTLYNVTFVNDSYANVYSSTAPFFLGNSTGAWDAATALATALNTFNVTGLTGTVVAGGGIVADIPDSITPGIDYTSAAAILPTGETWGAGTSSGGSFDTNYINSDQAVFASLGPTPVPAALPLFVAGLGALSLLAMRKKLKKAAAITTG